MTNYTNTFGGAAKDTAKAIILAAAFDTEYDALATMSATKSNKVSGATNNNVMLMDGNGDLKNSGELFSNIPKLDEAQTFSLAQAFSTTIAVTGLATLSGGTALPANDIITADINALAVTTPKIAADAIDSTKLADNAVNSEHYVDGSIDNAHIADNAVNSEHYAAGSIDSEHYAAGSVDTAAIGADQVDTSEIAAAAVGRTQIANSVTTASGDIGKNVAANLTLNDWALFPMIHVSQPLSVYVTGHVTDGTSAASPRLCIQNKSNVLRTWDMDHRWILAA